MYRVTPQVTSLYNALMNRGIKCKIEDDSDGHKTVDISIPTSRINIEVDGLHHFIDPNQIYSDFDRTYWSFRRNNADTFHVSNIIIDSHLEQVADALAIVATRCRKEIEETDKSIWRRIKIVIKNYI